MSTMAAMLDPWSLAVKCSKSTYVIGGRAKGGRRLRLMVTANEDLLDGSILIPFEKTGVSAKRPAFLSLGRAHGEQKRESFTG